MILESILILAFALGLDFSLGDPKSRFHPTAWIGKLIAKLTPFSKSQSAIKEKFSGIILVLVITSIVGFLLVSLDFGINLISTDYIAFIISIILGAILLKTTVAIRGMEKHAMAVVDSLDHNNLEEAQNRLALIVKRNTKELDKNHVISGVLESISENTVDGVTGPLFYYALFGLPGAFIYRAINTIDAMIGYKNSIFINVGWFGANCDKILNYIPSRLTGLVMVLSSMLIRIDWKKSYQIMIRDGTKTESLNAGYPMAALAGALQTKFEKLDHYTLGEGKIELSTDHIKSAINLMKISSILFSGIISLPIIIVLSYFGWWIHA